MKKLIQGIVDFRTHRSDDYRTKFAKLSQQQDPDALLIACCDSRVVPNTFASSDPGDLFVVRNVGNLVPPYETSTHGDYSTTSAIEFSLRKLTVKDIIVCGHSDCGAMHTILNPQHSLNTPHFETWLQYAQPSRERLTHPTCTLDAHLSPCDRLSQINVLQQLEHLKTYPSVNERLCQQSLRLHAWWFDLHTADVLYYNAEHRRFLIIDAEEGTRLLQTLS